MPSMNKFEIVSSRSIPGLTISRDMFPRPTINFNLKHDLNMLIVEQMIETSPFHEKFIRKLDYLIDTLLNEYKFHYPHIQHKLDYFIRITDYTHCNFNFVLMVRHETIQIGTWKREYNEFNIKYKS